MSTEVSATTGLDRYVPSVATDWDLTAKGRDWQQLDASLCFVDISGFTRLSERLARKGRIGAEELTDVLNYVFGRMLEVSYLHGGSLLKFGGDALLLMFTGHEHALRAASAAVEMRSVLKEAEDYETSVGRLRLRMSVGIHSGTIHLFRADGSHLELVVAGPGATATTTMEKAAQAGEIVISEGTRSRLPDASAPSRKDGGWILNWRKPRCDPIETVSRSVSRLEDVNRWVPRALRDLLQAGAPEPEHRIASVGFIRFCDVDRMVTSEGPAVAASRIQETMAIIQEASDDEGVTFLATDINEDGGKVILVGGAPVAREDDEGRLLRTMRRIVDAAAPLELHIGVNQGHVFAGEIGTRYRATYTIIGDTVNLAARLAAAAPANAIYATTSVLDNAAILFDSEPIKPFHVKGKEQPVHAYSVGAATGERAVHTEGELPFVGRDGELSQVTKAIWDTSDGNGTVLTIVGETGSGKSRLVREACLICSAVRAISIRSEPYGTSSPYRPLRDVFRSLLQIERASNDEMATALSERIAEIDPELISYLPFVGDVTQIEVDPTETVDSIEPRFRRDRLADAITRLLGHLLETPTVFDLEDAQWMDDASAELMSRVAAETSHRPWTVLVSRRGRDDGFMPAEGDVLELGGLSPEHAKALVIEATAAAPLRPHEIDAIVSRSGGNPLFLEEMLAVVRETGSVDDLPDSLGSVVSTAIDSVPPLARRILRYSSVLGRSFRTDVVNEILAEEGLRLDPATRKTLRRFLVPDGEGRLRFANAMVRDVAYDSLPFRRRSELHLRAAQVTEKQADDPDAVADLLSLHYSVGGDAERAWHYSKVAGDQARDTYANVEAAAHYVRAIESARRLPQVEDSERLLVWSDLGEVREQAGLFDAAQDAYQRAYRLAGDDLMARARVMLKRARTRERAGQYPVALRNTTEIKKLLKNDQSTAGARVKSQATSFAAFVRQRQEKPKEALDAATIAAEQARDSDDTAALARAYSVISWAHLMLDEPGAEQLLHEALSLYESLDDHVGQADVANNLGGLAYYDGEWDEALAFYQRSRSEFERVGSVMDVGFADMNIGELLVNQCRLDEAERVLRSASRVLRSIGYNYGAVFAEIQLGRCMIAMGNFEEAEALLRDIRTEVSGSPMTAAEAAIYLAESLVGKESPADALTLLDEIADDLGGEAAVLAPTEARIRAQALIALHRHADAAKEVDRGLREAAERGLDYERALLLEVEAGLDEPEAIARREEALEESRAILSRLGVLLPEFSA
jgi:class 3 adenylate cyclase/tetratricopeptide (TPR) repeat protein